MNENWVLNADKLTYANNLDSLFEIYSIRHDPKR